MNLFFYNKLKLLLVYAFVVQTIKAVRIEQCIHLNAVDDRMLTTLTKAMIPDMNLSKRKGDAGKILIIGGSTEYTGAPYFAAISALKLGADLVHVITTEGAAPVIKSYSPDIIVHPILNTHSLSKIKALLPKMHVVVIGPGLGRKNDDIGLFYEIVETCKTLKKPLVIDADGLYALSKNITILKDYPGPGAILTPNHAEAKRLKDAMPIHDDNDWFLYWGTNVSVLEKGQQDQFHSELDFIDWTLSEVGSGRRVGGQGDILAGSLATFFYWSIYSNLCEINISDRLGQGVSAFAAAKLTRTCNALAYRKHGRSMTASDMIHEIHSSFTELFEQY